MLYHARPVISYYYYFLNADLTDSLKVFQWSPEFLRLHFENCKSKGEQSWTTPLSKRDISINLIELDDEAVIESLYHL